MALTVTGYNQVFNCDTAGMSVGATEADLYAEGAGCLKLKVSNATSATVTYDLGTTGTDYSGKHFGMYLFIAGTWDTKAAGGIRLYAEDTSGNYYYWYVGGSDATYPGRKGFGLYTIDLDNTNPDSSSGTLNTTSLRYLGFQVKTVSKAIKENVFWDNLFVFEALTIHTSATEAMTIDDLSSWADTNENSLIVKLTDKVYLARTGIILGSTTAGNHLDFKTTSETLVFENRTVGDGGTAISASLYQWKVQGNSTGTINYETGVKSGTSGITGLGIQDNTGTCEVDFNDSNIDILKIYGGKFDGVTTITFPNLTGATYECLTSQFLDHDDIVHNGFKIDGGWVSVNAKDDAFVFTSNTHLIKYGTIINPTVNGWTTNQSGTISMEGVYFSGTDGVSNYDIENTNASALTVNVVDNKSNVQYKNENPGTITINNDVVLTFHVIDAVSGADIEDARINIVNSSTKAELYQLETNSSGIATQNYTYSGDLGIEGWARQFDLSGSDYIPNDWSGTITDGGFDVTIKLTPY